MFNFINDKFYFTHDTGKLRVNKYQFEGNSNKTILLFRMVHVKQKSLKEKKVNERKFYAVLS